MRLLLLSVLLFFAWTRQNEAHKTLKMVNLVYRHGARSPIEFYPTDPYQESFWPDGGGRLTQYGMRLEYELGKFFKERYIVNNSLVNQHYLHKEVYIQSSDTERCIQSAEAQLAALYPPKDYQIWNTQIPWQPVPVHTVPVHEDVMVRPDKAYCPRLHQIWKEWTESDEYKKKWQESLPLITKLNRLSGMQIDFDEFWIIPDSAICEKAEGLKIPKWVDEMMDELLALDAWLHKNHYSGKTDEMARLLGGALLGRINENMKTYAEGKDVSKLRKLNMWSGHDTSIWSLCGTLDIDCGTPVFASSIMIELYHSADSGYTVEILYRNGPVKKLRIKGCGTSCPLEKFLELTKVRTTKEDRSKICSVGVLGVVRFDMVLISLGSTFCLMMVVVIFCIAKRSMSYKDTFRHDPNDAKMLKNYIDG